MHNLVKSYLVHYAYVETLQAYEDEEMEWEGQGTQNNETNKEANDAQEVQDSKETEIEKAAKIAASKGLNGQSNVFPGLSQHQMK